MADRDPTVAVPRNLYARARAGVRLVRRMTGNSGYGMVDFTREAFVDRLRDIETTYNGGNAILPDPDPLERGRNIG